MERRKKEEEIVKAWLFELQGIPSDEVERMFGAKRRASETEEEEKNVKRQATNRAQEKARELGTTLPNILDIFPDDVWFSIFRQAIHPSHEEPGVNLLEVAAYKLRAFVPIIQKASKSFAIRMSMNYRNVIHAIDPLLLKWDGLMFEMESQHRTTSRVQWEWIASKFDVIKHFALIVIPENFDRNNYISVFIKHPKMEYKDHPFIRSPKDIRFLLQHVVTRVKIETQKHPSDIKELEWYSKPHPKIPNHLRAFKLNRLKEASAIRVVKIRFMRRDATRMVDVLENLPPQNMKFNLPHDSQELQVFYAELKRRQSRFDQVVSLNLQAGWVIKTQFPWFPNFRDLHLTFPEGQRLYVVDIQQSFKNFFAHFTSDYVGEIHHFALEELMKHGVQLRNDADDEYRY